MNHRSLHREQSLLAWQKCRRPAHCLYQHVREERLGLSHWQSGMRDSVLVFMRTDQTSWNTMFQCVYFVNLYDYWIKDVHISLRCWSSHLLHIIIHTPRYRPSETLYISCFFVAIYHCCLSLDFANI